MSQPHQQLLKNLNLPMKQSKQYHQHLKDPGYQSQYLHHQQDGVNLHLESQGYRSNPRQLVSSAKKKQ